MAIEWMENFQNYGTGNTGTNNMLDGMWADMDASGASTIYQEIVDDPDGVSSEKVFVIHQTNAGDDFPRRVLPSGSQDTVGLACRYWLDQLPNDSARLPILVQFRDSTNAIQVTCVSTTTGVIEVYRGDYSGGTLIGTSTIPVITAAAWNHIEFKVYFDNSAGTVEVRVNGVEKINETGLDTENTATGGCAQLVFGLRNSLAPNWNMYMKDMICWNATGSQNNDFIGDCQVVTLRPDADSSLNWGVSTGSTGWNLIDETVPDDADYISADSTPPSASVFTLSDLDPEVVTVKGLMPVGRMLKTDGGTANVQMSMRSNGTDDTGADNPITVTATYWFDISELDPDTGVSWTPTSVNNALFVVDRTA